MQASRKTPCKVGLHLYLNHKLIHKMLLNRPTNKAFTYNAIPFHYISVINRELKQKRF